MSLSAAPAQGASSPLLFDDEEQEDFPLLPDAEEGDDVLAGERERDERRRRLRGRGTGGLSRRSGMKELALGDTLRRGAGHDLFDMSLDSTSETTSSSSSSPNE